jgi:hypothetical protein
MYVPAGFPHTTDTATVVDDESVAAPVEEDDDSKKLFDDTSVHLTMGLDTQSHTTIHRRHRCSTVVGLYA